MSRKILVVDDDPRELMEIDESLAQQGYQVVTVADSREALGRFAEEHPDLVVLDVMMPYVDGFEILQTLRYNPETADLPVIMLFDQAPDFATRGIDAWMARPLDVPLMLNYVERIFKSRDYDPLREYCSRTGECSSPRRGLVGTLLNIWRKL